MVAGGGPGNRGSADKVLTSVDSRGIYDTVLPTVLPPTVLVPPSARHGQM